MTNVLQEYAFNLAYARLLVADVSQEAMCQSGGAGLENHPAFTIGHLVTGSSQGCAVLGLDRDEPDGWAELFERKGPGDRRLPESDASKYPGRDELIAELARQHERLTAAIHAASEAQLDTPCSWQFDNWMPNVRGVLTFLCTGHEALHLGQLAAWRRAMGLPAALAAKPHTV